MLISCDAPMTFTFIMAFSAQGEQTAKKLNQSYVDVPSPRNFKEKIQSGLKQAKCNPLS